MDPCPFVRIIIDSLSLKLPPASAKPSGAGVHPSTTPCFCTLHLHHNSTSHSKSTPVPLFSSSDPPTPNPSLSPTKVAFHLDPPAGSKPTSVVLSLYTGRSGITCGVKNGRLVGRVKVEMSVKRDEPAVYRNGWVAVGKDGPEAARLHLVVRSEPDPRFVFQFGGEPECSPVVYQCSGTFRQPVFSCRFSAGRKNTMCRSLSLDAASKDSNRSGWLWSIGSKRRDMMRREQRKGWTVTIHDLSGSPVAAASMITPFVPSPGSDRVSQSNPGAWLILRPTSAFPAANGWKPWARLEAWRERAPTNALGYRLELVIEPSADGTKPITESRLSLKKGGEFHISSAINGNEDGCFVMTSTVEGEGKVSRPMVQVEAQHVRGTADAALFVALSAAVDLSMDACRLFSKKLKKELCQDNKR